MFIMKKCLYTVAAAVSAAFLAVVSLSETAKAQALFQRPDTSPNYSNYTHPEECLSAMERVKGEMNSKSSIWLDTMQFSLMSNQEPLKPEVIEIGRHCLPHVALDSITLEDADVWLRTLLNSGRYKDAESVYLRLIETLEGEDNESRILNFMLVYSRALPVRLNDIVSLYHYAMEKAPTDSFDYKLLATYITMDVLRRSGDTTSLNKLLLESVAYVDTLPEHIKQTNSYKIVSYGLFMALQDYTRQEGMDSLSVSTQAYQNYLQSIWQRFMATPLPESFIAIGKKAPALEGDFWYSGEDGKISAVAPQARPVPGKVNAVVFLDGSCHSTTPSFRTGRPFTAMNCWGEIASLRRLKIANPELEVTVVSKTLGNIGNAPPLSPPEEADSLANFFLGFHKISGVQLVSQTDYFRLDKLDSRKIDVATANQANYDIDGERLGNAGTVLLIDGSGTIFHVGPVIREDEGKADLKIKAVLQSKST